MTGGGKTAAAIQKQQADALATQNQILQKAMEPTPEQKEFQANEAAFNTWKKAGDYSKPPQGETLGLDLWNPSHVSELQRREDNITGTGATALGMGGDDSIALGLARQRQNREDAQNAGASYEGAVNAADQYYKGNALPWASMQTQKYGNLFGTASNNTNQLTDDWIKFASRPSMLGQILGGALGAAGSFFTGGFSSLGSKGAGGCWIAEAIYGVDDYRTLLLRSWLNAEFKTRAAGRVVMTTYIAIGRQVAASVRRVPVLKRLFKPLFERALTRALNDRYAV